jgi:PHD/YefM family antitoxin component YafN of YafNO toxin-antitoxin module
MPFTAMEEPMDLRIRLDELLPSKTAARELPEALARLERGDAEQLVITRRNQPRAVLITVERYQQLLHASTDSTA